MTLAWVSGVPEVMSDSFSMHVFKAGPRGQKGQMGPKMDGK